ncbi:histone deacetylase PWA37_001052 [Arxiozyma heterogenica]|uniref:Histone deacetylase domain-containing protein n=1 Tax=Arxiozyma heterogenica TaxID=278026 RepID=A0AAN7ZX02_9SACH|nr:hypothetical protein RI543_004580 [Kazachstania heterogenica]
MSIDPLEKFHLQFQSFVENNPNVISAARAASQIPEAAKAVIILSPLSLQHIFSRQWVSKSYKKTIVERPERLLASSIGIAAAITMYPALFSLKSSFNRMGSLTAPHVTKVHAKSWSYEITKLCQEASFKLSEGQIEVPDDWNSGDIYLSPTTINALCGTIGAIETGIDTIFSGPSPEHICNRTFVAIRPPGHHCHVSTPSGFCLLNNAHIAIEYAFDKYDVTHAVILDFDLHHGDGSQAICWKRAGFKPDDSDRNEHISNYKSKKNIKYDELNNNITDNKVDSSENYNDDNIDNYNDFGKKLARFPKVGYFSLHDINSFPTETGYATSENIKNASTCIMNSHDLNIWNIHLSPWDNEEDFMKLYRSKYRTLFAKADEFFKLSKQEMLKLKKPFKGLVVISAGFDASEYEQHSMQRHNVNLPTEFYTIFTKDALKLAQMHCQGKVISLMEGGYSDKAICSGVFAHLIGLQNQDWIKEWGSEQVVKEISRGCKPNWKPYKSKKSKDVIRIWAEEVIKLGRAMIPEFEDVIFKEANPSIPSKKSEGTIAQRISRNKVQSQEANGKPSRRLKQDIPFLQQEFSSEDEEDDADYVYDEELNKTFNQTVEDITIDDISRHLETLEIIQSDEETDAKYSKLDTVQKQKHSFSTKYQYKAPSNFTKRQIRYDQTSNPSLQPYDDTDISMISHISTRRHTTRSGRKW